MIPRIAPATNHCTGRRFFICAIAAVMAPEISMTRMMAPALTCSSLESAGMRWRGQSRPRRVSHVAQPATEIFTISDVSNPARTYAPHRRIGQRHQNRDIAKQGVGHITMGKAGDIIMTAVVALFAVWAVILYVLIFSHNTDNSPLQLVSTVLIWLAVAIVSIGVYFLPTIIAAGRGIPNAASVAVINVFLGWTFLGWVVALAMAVSGIRSGNRTG